MFFSLQFFLHHGRRRRKQRNRVRPPLPAALLFITDRISPDPPSLFLCCTGLYPHYPLNDSLPVITWLLLLLLMTNSGSSHSLNRKSLPPVSCPDTGKDLLSPKGKKPHQTHISSAAFLKTVLIRFLGICLLFRHRWASLRNKQDLL